MFTISISDNSNALVPYDDSSQPANPERNIRFGTDGRKRVVKPEREQGQARTLNQSIRTYRVEERQLAAAAEASMREVSDADDADDADDDEDDERSRSRLMSPDSRPPEDVERLVAGLSAQLEDARDALEIAENELTCQICFEERRDAVLMPCMHMLYCVGCVDRVATEAMRSGQPDRCPCCRQSVCGVLRCKASARGG